MNVTYLLLVTCQVFEFLGCGTNNWAPILANLLLLNKNDMPGLTWESRFEIVHIFLLVLSCRFRDLIFYFVSFWSRANSLHIVALFVIVIVCWCLYCPSALSVLIGSDICFCNVPLLIWTNIVCMNLFFNHLSHACNWSGCSNIAFRKEKRRNQHRKHNIYI